MFIGPAVLLSPADLVAICNRSEQNYAVAFWEIRKHSILFTYGESLQHRRLIPDGESGDGAVATYLSWNTYYDNKKNPLRLF